MFEGVVIAVGVLLMYQLSHADAGQTGSAAEDRPPSLTVLSEYRPDEPLGQLRAVPVDLGEEQPQGFLLVHSACGGIDPWWPYFTFPTDVLRLSLVTETGDVLWKRELGKGIVPGVWFAPVFPFDLDGDGVEEIWLVNNLDERHPFAIDDQSRVLEKWDARTGQTLGRWPWPGGIDTRQSLSDLFRFYIFGGSVRGEPVLVTAQGTYLDMALQGWRPDMTMRWSVNIGADEPGARASHLTVITDFDGDGAQEFMWGERCIDFDRGRELFCADRDVYRGHSDIVQPFWDDDGKQWLIFTCREKDPEATPRVVMFDSQGRRVWGDVDAGHMHTGGVAKLAPDGLTLAWVSTRDDPPREFIYEARTGRPVTSSGIGRGAYPVDCNGDGLMELAYGPRQGEGRVADRHGNRLATFEGRIVTAGKLTSHPGEQIMTYTSDGAVRIWGCSSAQDMPRAKARWANPLYAANRRVLAVGYNTKILGAFQCPSYSDAAEPEG